VVAEPAHPGPVASARAEKGAGRSLWWRVHQWAGLQLSLFLAFVFVTGTLAVFSSEIDWMLRPAMWAAPTPEAERVSWGALGEAVQAHAPDRPLAYALAPIHPAMAFDALVADPDGGQTHVYVHPRTGDVTGEGSWAGVQRFLRNTHRHLMLPVKWGVPIVSISAILLAVSLVTSFWTYKKWWRGFFRWPRGRTARALVGDLHRFMGLWSLWFVVVMIVTGGFYLVEVLGGAAPPLQAQVEQAPETQPAAPLSEAEAIDRGIVLLRARLPDFKIEQVRWPTDADPTFVVHGYTDRAVLVRARANAARIDAGTGNILSIVDPSTLSVHQRISEAADPLHFGYFGGYLTKTIWFVFGAGLSALAVTGVVIYALRILKAETAAAPWRAGLARSWLAMGPARWAALALVVLPFALAPFVL
jgi:uncharacterized iron-regulated membrane protein